MDNKQDVLVRIEGIRIHEQEPQSDCRIYKGALRPGGIYDGGKARRRAFHKRVHRG